MTENFMWMPYPYVRYVAFLIFGILASNYAGNYVFFEVCFLTFGTLFALIFLCRGRLKPATGNVVLGTLGLIIVFNVGALRFYQNDQRNNGKHLIRHEGEVKWYAAKVVEEGVRRKNYLRFKVGIHTVKSEKNWGKVHADAYLYVKTDSSLFTITYGDQLLVQGTPRKIKNTSNPEAFDYKNYLARQNIFHQHFIDPGEMMKYASGGNKTLIGYASRLRKKVNHIIQRAIKSDRERSIVLSLLIGEKEALHVDVKDTYATVGAMHVLAVSGLHVGIVYLLFSTMLGFLRKHKRGRWLFLVICLGGMWFYALLTGLSTSVLRAVVMFTFILLSDVLDRKSNIYNNIALTAFLLLLVNPLFLFHVGFQLSFIAVTGIVYLQPKIAKWFSFKYRIFNWLWDLTAVSLAAQIATFPISIYYFHQFPTYFWLTNIVVIPAATVIVSLGIFISVLGFAGVSVSFVSVVLEKLVFLMNEGLIGIEALPLSSVKDLYFTVNGLVLFYAWILALILFFQTFKIRYFRIGAFFLLLITIQSLLHHIQTYDQSLLVFYDINRVCAMDFINGHRQNFVVVLGKGMTLPDLHRPIANYRLARGLNTKDLSKPITVLKSPNPENNLPYQFLSWKTAVFLLLNDKIDFSLHHDSRIKIDYLIVNNQAIGDFDQILMHFEFDKLIVTNLNTYQYATDLSDYCRANGIHVYSIPHHGALVEELKGDK
ncbi:ComEC/Rec2 family competence protein [Fulvivirgaceae bacterium BMA12]|uniref:ComEC/Rec2 family competence protein n=1 Tax=Agaribacillus aureus TaxID=3051825 RepID=A0ABT8L382_9BACT|nr:ComEC/Rec2 family competence protein [Fulvivirgaceae bacterium BMA12]